MMIFYLKMLYVNVCLNIVCKQSLDLYMCLSLKLRQIWNMLY